MRRAAPIPARLGPAALAVFAGFAIGACSSAAPAASPDANVSATVTPIWTAPPAGFSAPPSPAPSPTPSAVVDAASGIALTGTYRLVYRPNDASLTDTFTAALSTSGLKPRTASREVWDDTGHVGGMVVLDLVGLDLADDALTTFASTFANQANADLTWATVGAQRVAVISQGDQRIELFLLGGDVVVVAGIQPGVTDDITRSLIQQNA